ncbi:uncharacterized protein RSE6_10394 [Rhynchosporium secalis]|uniref:Uncharacterized protein n=1 Tax=Rhynchosporium secalis TaxID=38038 RepID=A0A1E1MKB0_RHYSE|nr:uncharacterized protein RSE6_10394 [Rhynchosporium secalis]
MESFANVLALRCSDSLLISMPYVPITTANRISGAEVASQMGIFRMAAALLAFQKPKTSDAERERAHFV